MRNISWALTLLVPSALALGGCGSSKDSTEKQLANLKDEVTLLQNEHDRMAERMQALEIKALQAQPQRSSKSESGAAEGSEERVVRPQLRVVKVGPGSEAPEATEETPEPPAETKDGQRPVIREYGKPPPPAKPVPPGVRAVSGTLSQDQPGAAWHPNPRGS